VLSAVNLGDNSLVLKHLGSLLVLGGEGLKKKKKNKDSGE
jgi:hypothetical protein